MKKKDSGYAKGGSKRRKPDTAKIISAKDKTFEVFKTSKVLNKKRLIPLNQP